MAKIQLAAMCTFLFAFLPCQALDCLSKCCSEDDVDRVGKLLVSGLSQTPSPSLSQTLPDTKECWASSEGEHGQRSVSPWRYRSDWEPNRYPQHLMQAYCSCSRCISLQSKEHDSRRNYTSLAVNGNSVPIQFNTTVFIRKLCKHTVDRYILEPKSHPVTVSCACLAARHQR